MKIFISIILVITIDNVKKWCYTIREERKKGISITVMECYWLILILGMIIGWGTLVSAFIAVAWNYYVLGAILFIISVAFFAVSFFLPLSIFNKKEKK